MVLKKLLSTTFAELVYTTSMRDRNVAFLINIYQVKSVFILSKHKNNI